MLVPAVTQLALQQSMQPVVQLAPHMSVMQPAMPCVAAAIPACAQQMAVPQFALQPDVWRVPLGGFAVQPDASRVPSCGLPALAQPQPAFQPAVQPLAAVPESGIDMNEVLQAVESLYRDQLHPYGRILRKRLDERAVEAGRSADVDARKLQQACEACPWLQTQSESGGEWSALLRGRADCFVNVYSPEDCYPIELWEAARAYFAALDEKSMVLPSGRYSCAQALVGRRLPFLAGFSLGQVCHIVQLAISQKKLLGYLRGAVVPYGRSVSMLKERCAERQTPCNSGSRGGTSLATWDMVRAFLRDALDGTGGRDFLPLSNVKRMFRSKFGAELSETSLGHSKLSELLLDPRVADLCAVRLQKHGCAVLPLPRPEPAGAIGLGAPTALQPATIVGQAPPAQARGGRPAPPSLEEKREETVELQASSVEPDGRAPVVRRAGPREARTSSRRSQHARCPRCSAAAPRRPSRAGARRSPRRAPPDQHARAADHAGQRQVQGLARPIGEPRFGAGRST